MSSKAKPTDISIIRAQCGVEKVHYRTPLKFGGRVMTDTVLIDVEVTVENGRGEHASGFGAMPVGNIWAWPTVDLEPAQTEKAMCQFAEQMVGIAEDYNESGHPMELMYQLEAEYPFLSQSIATQLHLSEGPPELAQLVAASALDAAVHDAYGRVNDMNSYQMLSSEFMNDDLGEYLDDRFAGEYLDQYVSGDAVETLPLYHLVGALDPLTDDDIETRINDKRPETLVEWIQAEGLTHLKIKLNGDDLDWDVKRVIRVNEIADQLDSTRAWHFSLDFNEKCEDVQYVHNFLDELARQTTTAMDRIQYIEQPMPRDLNGPPKHDVSSIAAKKPVVIDESLTGYESLLLAKELGYTGVALKACKGQTGSLLMAAAAQKFGMFLCVQDLTCPGASFLQSAALAAHVPGVAAIEGNGRQYCPDANKKWSHNVPPLFQITSGTVGTHALDGIGLGF